MSRSMLINGRHAEELRVAILNDGELDGYRVEVAESGVERGNIYRGVVANIEPSLDAAFIDYGGERHGFLACHDIVAQAYHRTPEGAAHPTVDQVLDRGRPLLVQVTKDAVGTKGAALTTDISLAGRYMVLMPFGDSRGVSRKVEDDDLRHKLKEKVKSLVADDFGFIVRTNAVDQTKTALKADLEALKRLWKGVLAENDQGKGPRLLYSDQDLVVQVLRDHLDASFDEVLVDDERLLEKAQLYLAATMPRSKIAIKRYEGRIPLFSHFNIEPKIAAIYERVVRLPSGGSIVIDMAEALTAIDVNSGKATSGASQEETAYCANMEAAVEVARQLRLRDIGGLCVVDFIDMRQRKHGQEVERALREAMKRDKARSHLGRISANGLLEINRQRIGQALQLRTQRLCPTCQGVGRLINPELMAIGLLRRIEARAATGKLRKARVALHPQMADAVQNRRRRELFTLEHEFGITIEIVGKAELGLGEEETAWTNRDPGEEQPRPRALPAAFTEPDHSASAPAPAAAAPSAPTPAFAEPTSTEPTSTASAHAGEPGESSSRSRRRRRRRNRRGKGRESAANAQRPAEPTANALPPSESTPEPVASAEVVAASERAHPPTGRRRRGRRRSRRTASPEHETSAAPTPELQPGGEPRRRTRRHRARGDGPRTEEASESASVLESPGAVEQS